MPPNSRNARHSNNTLKALTGSPPGQMIRQEFALEAQRLLAQTEVTAAAIGIHNPAMDQKLSNSLKSS